MPSATEEEGEGRAESKEERGGETTNGAMIHHILFLRLSGPCVVRRGGGQEQQTHPTPTPAFPPFLPIRYRKRPTGDTSSSSSSSSPLPSNQSDSTKVSVTPSCRPAPPPSLPHPSYNIYPPPIPIPEDKSIVFV